MPEDKSVHIRKATEKIELNGELSEADWKTAEIAGSFWQNFPSDTSLAIVTTEVKMTYDAQNLYVGATCYDTTAGAYVVQSLRRDWSYPKTDAFVVYIDPFCDKTSGFAFGVNPMGAQREGLVQNGGSMGVSTDWDNRWFSEVKQFEGGWVVEIAIPFKTLRYKKDIRQWRVNFSRNSLKHNENSSWVQVPRNFNVATLAFTGIMEWDEPPPRPGANVSLIPYALASLNRDYENDVKGHKYAAGMDAKIAVTSALNLDLTLNPDFSHVEVDKQVTNLSRFSLFFPERRQFFIENSDLFSRFGFRSIRPFFSRRIGLSQGKQVPILGGMRLSGKLNSNWRVGLMNMQTEGMDTLNLRPQNFTVAAFQRQVFNRSNIGAIFVNRQACSGHSPAGDDYNRLASVEYNHASKDNRIQGKAFYQMTWTPGVKKDRGANAVWLMYSDQNWNIHYNHEWVEKNFNAETGFVPRKQYLRFEPSILRKFYPKNSPVLSHGPEVYLSNYFDNKTFELIENQIDVNYYISMKNRSEFKFTAQDWNIWLQAPFDPTGRGLTPLSDSTNYHWSTAGFNYAKDFRKELTYTVYTNVGGYFSGQKFTLGGSLSLRKQPWGNITIDFEQNFISLEDTFVALTLLSPYIDISVSRNIFLTTFVQFNTQTGNCNLNARFQWRFKPMSDLYIVYTDNYHTSGLGIRNRSITLKLNYWFTL